MVQAAASVGLWLLNKDDERYKDLEDWDKDANHHIFIGDGPNDHLVIPKGFEVGAIFSTIPGLQHIGDVVAGVLQTIAQRAIAHHQVRANYPEADAIRRSARRVGVQPCPPARKPTQWFHLSVD